ncbi:MAG: hypothetical protein RSD47_02160 [Romboutsia sp.]
MVFFKGLSNKLRFKSRRKRKKSYDNEYWYLSVGVEQEEVLEELTDVSLGIDLELKDLAICSDSKI